MRDIITILSSGALSSVLVFLFRNWISERIKASIQHEYDQKLETHKAQLKAESEISVEKLKSQLQVAAAERSIKLTKVFEQQADAIAETYSKLVTMITTVEEYTSVVEYENTPSKAIRRKKVGEKMTEFYDYYKPRRIYLPKETQSSIDAFAKQLGVTTMTFMFNVEQNRQRPTENPEDDTWMKTLNFMNKECVQIMNNLDSDLKKILGLIEDGENS